MRACTLTFNSTGSSDEGVTSGKGAHVNASTSGLISRFDSPSPFSEKSRHDLLLG